MVIVEFTADEMNQVLDAESRSITLYPVARTTKNISGVETLSYSTSSTIQGSFFKKNHDWFQNNQGLIQSADAILIVKLAVSIKKNDKVVIAENEATETFIVDEVEIHYRGPTPIYKVVRLFMQTQVDN